MQEPQVSVSFTPKARKDLPRIDKPYRTRILSFLRDRVARLDDPRSIGEVLVGPLQGLWKYRVGDYRILCRIEDAKLIVLVLIVGHRREVYR
jgi:mRNA interferase RelE/StbE